MVSNRNATVPFPREGSSARRKNVFEIYTCVRDWDESGTPAASRSLVNKSGLPTVGDAAAEDNSSGARFARADRLHHRAKNLRTIRAA